MNLQIEESVFRWLLSLELCKTSEAKHLKNSKVELSSPLTSSIENGTFIVKVLQTLLKKYNIPNSPSLSNSLSAQNFKQVTSPASRFYNWNMISESLKTWGFILDKETVNLIVLGDLPMINEFLKELFYFYRNTPKTIANSSSIDSFELSKSIMIINDSNKVIKSLPKTNEAIELMGLQFETPLKESQSIMEFFVLALAQSLNLKPNQAATLLTKNTKYLSHVLAKGSKGEFLPVIAFFQSFVNNQETFLTLLQQEDSKKSLNFFFQAIKAGLVSKNSEVSLWTLKTYELFIDIIDSYGIYDIVWSFLTEYAGVKNLFLCLKRHPELQDLILRVLIAFGKKQLYELFNERLKGIFTDDKDLFFVLSRIVKNLSENPLTKTQIHSSGALLNWIEISHAVLNKPIENSIISIATRIQSISLLSEIWRLYPQEFHSNIGDFLNGVKSNFNFKSKLLQTFIILEFFNLMKSFVKEHGNQHTSVTIIYNLMIGILIENFSLIDLRTILIEQFIEAFNSNREDTISQIPLLESLNIHLASLDTKTFQWNISDFALMNVLADNENIPLKSALIFLDIQAKILLNNQIFARIVNKPFLRIFTKNKKHVAIGDFIIKFTKNSLNHFLNLHKKATLKENRQKQINNKKAIPEYSDIELNTLKSNKKAIILETLKELLLISEEELRDKLKLLISQTLYQMKKYISKKLNKNLLMLLESIGEDAEKFFINYEADYYQKISKMRDDEKKNYEQKQQKAFEIDNISRISGDSMKDLTTNALTLSLDLSHNPSRNQSEARRRSFPSLSGSPSKRMEGDKRKLDKAEELKMNLLRNAKIDPRLRKKLQIIEDSKKEKKINLDQTSKENETKLQIRKVKLRKQIELKNKEIGVLARNIKDHETILLFPLDSINRESDTLNFELIEEALFEDYERKMVQEVLKQKSFNRILKRAFIIYASSRKRIYNPITFDKISLNKETLSFVEFWSFYKDLEKNEGLRFNPNNNMSRIEAKANNISRETSGKGNFSRISNENLLKTHDNLIKPNEKELMNNETNLFTQLSRDTLLKVMKNLVLKQDTKSEGPILEYPQFQRFLISIAKFLFPFEEIALAFGKLVEKIENLINYREKDTKTIKEEEELKEINRKLEEDVNFEIPEGFFKIKETKTQLIKELPTSLNDTPSIPQSFLVSYEIIDEILENAFQINLLEKFPIERTYYHVLPLKPLKKTTFNKEFNKEGKDLDSLLNIIKEEEKGAKGQNEASNKQKDLKENNKEEIKKKKRKLKTQLLAKAFVNKRQVQEELKKEEAIKLKAQQTKDKEKLEEKKKHLEQLQRNRESFEKQMKVLWEKKHQLNLIEPKSINTKEDSMEEKEKKERMKKEFEEFSKKQLKDFRENFKKAINDRKKIQEDSITKSHLITNKLKIFNEKILPKQIEDIKQKSEEIKENQILITQGLKNPGIQGFFRDYEEILKALFHFLINQTYTPLNFHLERRTVPLQTLVSFANEFSLCPLLCKVKNVMNFYKNITKSKSLNIEKNPVGLDYEEFLESLFRIAIKGNEVLNKLSEFLIMGGFIKPLAQIEEINEEENNRTKKTKKRRSLASMIEMNKEVLREKYLNVTKTNENTMVALIYYMEFPLDPKDKDGVVQRMKEIVSLRKRKPTKYRFLELQKKLEGEGFEKLEAKKKEREKQKKLKNYSKEIKTEGESETKLPKINSV